MSKEVASSVPSLPADDAGSEAVRAGLSSKEASRRLAEHGRNELTFAEPDRWYTVLFRQFRSPMIAFLAVCAVITAIEQHWVDTVAIAAVLILNAAVGFWQERKAASDVRALASLTTPTCTVLRDGTPTVLAAAEVVPGDVVLLESGDRVPADLRLIETNALRIDESMLTGEVLPVTKSPDAVPAATPLADRTDSAFSGTLVVAGRGRGVVTATGANSELGAINALVQVDPGKTPLQVLTARLERSIGVVILLVAIGIVVAGLAIGNDLSESFRTGVALVVSAMPEALPIVLTIALGVGVSRMAARHAVVRRLPSVETLGSTTVIGSDKTGTLTQNRLTVEAIWTASGRRNIEPGVEPNLTDVERDLVRAGALTNEARLDGEGLIGDAVDVAMLALAIHTDAIDEQERSRPPLADQPYEPDAGYSQTVCEGSAGSVLYAKGAPDKVLGFCTQLATPDGPASLDADAVLAANDEFGRAGLRVIAAAARPWGPSEGLDQELPSPAGLTFLGLEAMMDPPRPGVVDAVAACRDAGIHVMMITGDHPVTASAIGERLGLAVDSAPITGSEIGELSDAELAERLENTSIAARMTPQDKLRIVNLLADRGETVAVTGDGVNDAPALRAAAIGVAMGKSGTDVAREASDVVLTDDNFVTIVDAVAQGRATFATIRKATFFLLSSAVATMLAVAVNTFTHHPLIFLPVMMLWLNIVTNGLQDVALAFEPGEGDELQQQPRRAGEGILDRNMWLRTVLTGVWMAVITLVIFDRAVTSGDSVEQARTLALTAMVSMNFFQVLNARTERRSTFTVSLWRNPFLLSASVGALVLHWAATTWAPAAGVLGLAPLTVSEWLLCLGLGATVLVLVEGEKLLRRRSA